MKKAGFPIHGNKGSEEESRDEHWTEKDRGQPALGLDIGTGA